MNELGKTFTRRELKTAMSIDKKAKAWGSWDPLKIAKKTAHKDKDLQGGWKGDKKDFWGTWDPFHIVRDAQKIARKK